MTVPSDVLDARRHLIGAALAPGGNQAAAAVGWRDDERDRCAILVLDLATDEVLAQLDGGGLDSAPAYASHGARLAFISDRTGKAQLYVAAGDRFEPRRLTDEPDGVVGPPRWSPDGRRVAVAVPARAATDPAAPKRVSRSAWRKDGVGLVTDNLTQVMVVDTDGTAPHQRLTDGTGRARPLAWAPQGDRLLLACSLRPDARPGELGEELWEASLDGSCRKFDVPRSDGLLATYGPDQTILLSQPERTARPFCSEDHLWRLDARGDLTDLTGAGVDVGGDVYADAPGDFIERPDALYVVGDAVIVRTQRGGELGVQAVSLDGSQTLRPAAMHQHHCCHPLDVRDGTLLYARTAISAPPTLRLIGLNGNGDRDVAVPGLAGRPAPTVVERNLGPCPSWLLPPAAAAPPYPTVLMVHGGPHLAFGETYLAAAERLRDVGFAVLLANPPGSRGYGDPYAQATFRDWGGVDADALLATVDAAVAGGLADPQRLGVTGLSYGGYMAFLLAARTSVFAAAVGENGVSDLAAMRYTSDIGPQLISAYFGDDSEPADERMRQASPLRYAARCTTPTLIIAGTDDARVPPTQGIAFFTALREAGCPTELLLLPGASHLSAFDGPLVVRRAQERAVVDWFVEHLG